MTSPGGCTEWGGVGPGLPPTHVCLPPGSLLRSRETYNSLAAWLTDARTLASPNIVVILCGNKKDLDLEREVTFLEASRFAQENGEGWVRGAIQWGPWASWLSVALPSRGMWRFRGLGSNLGVATLRAV